MILNMLFTINNRPLCIFLAKMSTYRRDFDKTKCMSFSKKEENCKKNIMKFEKKSAILPKNILTATLYTMKDI